MRPSLKAQVRIMERPNLPRHCEERSDEAIHASRAEGWIASRTRWLAVTAEKKISLTDEFIHLGRRH
jgi:hypothetical protein